MVLELPWAEVSCGHVDRLGSGTCAAIRRQYSPGGGKSSELSKRTTRTHIIVMRYNALLVAVLMLVLPWACGPSTPEQPPPTSSPAVQPESTPSSSPVDGPTDTDLANHLSLRFAQLPISYSILTHVAETGGYYAQVGLAYELVSAPEDADVIASLRSKTTDAAIAGGISITPVAKMIAAGDAPVIIATTMTSAAHANLLTFAQTGITGDPSTLRGKRIGVTRDTICEIYLSRLLAQTALSESDVIVVTGGPADLQTFLLRGDVDAAIIAGPYKMQIMRKYIQLLSRSRARDRGRLTSYVDPHLCTLAFNIVTTRAKLTANRPALVRMLRALIQAEVHIRAQRSEVQGELAHWLEVWPDDLDHLFETSEFRVALYPAQIRKLLREGLTRLKQRDPKTIVPDDVSPFVDTSLLLEIDTSRVSR
jgi:ABC-type nitrate/sulfonate/bicarbonate transport system substrate-binding protein